MKLHTFLWLLLCVPTLAVAHHGSSADGQVDGLDSVTVLVVRHAEKPAQGPGLSPRGAQRAQAYAGYFDPLRIDGETLRPQRLIATSDTVQSERPRLTLAPLAARLQLPVEQPFADKQVDKLVKALREHNRAAVVLIAWHHGHIRQLIEAFGADAGALLGLASWPGNAYDWVIVLRFDGHGQLIATRSERIRQHLLPGD